MRIAMIGATGLVGGQLWPRLEAAGDLLVLGRRPSGARREKSGAMDAWPGLLEGEALDVAVSTLGTTRKAAGSWAAFEAVDRHAVLGFARAARKAGARQFLLVSSSGADASSRNAYLRLKGEVEAAVEAMGFARVDICRPGLLLGDRPERRVGEGIGQALAPLLGIVLRGPLDRYAPIDAGIVAAAMARLSGKEAPGHFIHHNRELKALAG